MFVGVKVSVGVAVAVSVGVGVSVAVPVEVAVAVRVGFGVLVCGGVPITSSLLMTVLADVLVIGISGKPKKGMIGAYNAVILTTTRSPEIRSLVTGQTELIGSMVPQLSGP